jgi:hypothetical protein
LFNVLPRPAVWITLAGPQIEHMSFTDLLLFRGAEDAGKRAAALHNLQLVRKFTRRYFDVYLTGQPRALMSPSSAQYPDVTFRTR